MPIAALVAGDDELAAGPRRRCATARRRRSAARPTGSPPSPRGDTAAYRAAVDAIVADFAARSEHLTGVPIADTALMLERLAAERGMAAGVRSPLLPA